MDNDLLHNKLVELGMSAKDADEVVDWTKDNPDEVRAPRAENNDVDTQAADIQNAMGKEDDWRVRAAMAARVISLRLGG